MWIRLVSILLGLSAWAYAGEPLRQSPPDAAIFVQELRVKPHLSEALKKLLSSARLTPRIMQTEAFARFTQDIAQATPMRTIEPGASYSQRKVRWSAASRARLESDLRIVRYPDRTELVMERVVLVEKGCERSLGYGEVPSAPSSVPGSYLLSLLYSAWKEEKVTGKPVWIVGKRLNTNARLNRTLSRLGFVPLFPAENKFLRDEDGQIDWQRSLEAMADQNANVAMVLRF